MIQIKLPVIHDVGDLFNALDTLKNKVKDCSAEVPAWMFHIGQYITELRWRPRVTPRAYPPATRQLRPNDEANISRNVQHLAQEFTDTCTVLKK